MPTFSSARPRFFASSRVNAFCPNAFNRVDVFWNSGSDAISFNVSGTKEEEEEEEARVELFLEEFSGVRLSPIAHLAVLKLVVVIISSSSILVSLCLREWRKVSSREEKPHN